MSAETLDSGWLRRHPLPDPDAATDKNGRGRVLAIGGSRLVPGGLLLTAEAALRAGAGKVQMASVRSAALALGIAMPEAAAHALDETPDGEIANLDGCRDCLDRSDAIVLGPAMGCGVAAGGLVDRLLERALAATLVLDAGALMRLGDRAPRLALRAGEVILTPHLGEMAAMLGRDAEAVASDREGMVREAAARFGAVVVLKGQSTLIAAPGSALALYGGGGVGLATGGSGDVLAGIVSGLAARGVPAWEAALWGCWLHGEAGRRAAERVGPVGFLARELLAHIPAIAHSLR